MIVLRRNIVLGLVAASLVAAHVLLEPPQAVEREVRPLLPLIDVDAVTRLEISAPGGELAHVPPADRGATSRCSRSSARGRGAEISVLLSELAAMTDLDVVGLGAGAAADFGLDDEGATRIGLDGPPGTAATLRVAAAEAAPRSCTWRARSGSSVSRASGSPRRSEGVVRQLRPRTDRGPRAARGPHRGRRAGGARPRCARARAATWAPTRRRRAAPGRPRVSERALQRLGVAARSTSWCAPGGGRRSDAPAGLLRRRRPWR